ncbi:MAG: sigma-70 family RNA polymerase sigma factor [Hamadaea sp.]|uniref:sigma-70 family RNA polymerase sigma factor n=1 Tax=Hamadaea sp. NPDC050747 TaxID=3155789 RepID=UPI00179F8EED|nr:sigma-70 family RNA polymerase sigma factor [Hamadaea sp.]NUR48644.1 sigma-70 family RNA polymerase sigma factor [Hamadaea sp.]NUT05716.1 sigma-70 family RNA polymerase sigma factor [Hamadaea sp.]
MLDDDAYLTELALAAKAGDQQAVAQFVARTQRDVIRFVGYLGNPGEAEDLAQETFIRAMKALPSFEARSPARTWLLAIARHTVFDHLRAQSRRPRAAAVEDWTLAADLTLAGTGPRFDEQVLLRHLVAGLDGDRREAFVATQILGLSYEQAADVLGCPVGTIRSRVARARDDLAAALTDDGDRRRGLRAV